MALSFTPLHPLFAARVSDVNLSSLDDHDALESTLEAVLSKVQRAAPHANQVTKALLHQVGQLEMEHLLDEAAQQFAAAVNSDEGAEGTLAFVQKRLPNWAQ